MQVYIPLPDQEARIELIKNLLKKQDNSLTDADVEKVADQTNGYSGSDLHALCSEAALGPLRALRGQVYSFSFLFLFSSFLSFLSFLYSINNARVGFEGSVSR